jgi:hypothetical protein
MLSDKFMEPQKEENYSARLHHLPIFTMELNHGLNQTIQSD